MYLYFSDEADIIQHNRVDMTVALVVVAAAAMVVVLLDTIEMTIDNKIIIKTIVAMDMTIVTQPILIQ